MMKKTKWMKKPRKSKAIVDAWMKGYIIMFG
jgi:hypothetical protein